MLCFGNKLCELARLSINNLIFVFKWDYARWNSANFIAKRNIGSSQCRSWFARYALNQSPCFEPGVWAFWRRKFASNLERHERNSATVNVCECDAIEKQIRLNNYWCMPILRSHDTNRNAFQCERSSLPLSLIFRLEWFSFGSKLQLLSSLCSNL